uniref:Uncharacterized protein n=1 Tax=Onchocerca volvulus TaxID=6282 RepID=A0A8R1U1Y9_ONCVO
GIRKAPEQLFVQTTTIGYCPPHAFSELTHIKHIWFRNTTIDILATETFAGLTDIDYIYFRDCIIRHIEHGAFGSMRRTQHFFVRGNITIQSSESVIFQNSRIENVIFEDVHFTVPSDCFVGLKSANTQLVSCTWNLNKKFKKFQNTRQKIGHFSIHNSTLDLINIETFRNARILSISYTNQCSKPEMCRQPLKLNWTFYDVICRLYHFLAKYFCTNSKFALSILIINNCKALNINLANNDKILSFHIFRIDILTIRKMPKNLKISEILYKNYENCTENFVIFQLSSFILKNSAINCMQLHAFSNSSIKMLHAEKSTFQRMFDFWKYLNNTILVEVLVNLRRYLLEEVQNLCSKEVIIACECLTEQLNHRNK